MQAGTPCVLILGAGINGAALARELTLNGVSVWLVDTADIASGATSGSSRLIHGGLRYLEYGEFDLVRESLAERGRLLQLAPQFVRPLKLSIPISGRFGGTFSAVGRFFGWDWWPGGKPRHGRGLSLIRAGLALYDAFARDPHLPKHQVSAAANSTLPVDHERYRWLCSYYDAQVVFPERLVVALLEDARQLAAQQGLDFRVLNYHEASLTERGEVEIRSLLDDGAALSLRPSAIVNATGAWVDLTLKKLHVPADRLMGGTKGSHLFTFNEQLRDALGGEGLYAEAEDGRPIFITPLAGCVLIGTTDELFDGDPTSAIASDQEVDYLLSSVNAIFGNLKLNKSDVAFHYSAVRPLPFVTAHSTAAITRRHAIVENEVDGLPLFTLVGGKLTTMRSLAESAAQDVLGAIGRSAANTSRERVIPGGEDYPADLAERQRQIADRVGLPLTSIEAVWRLVGSRTESILSGSSDRELLVNTNLPRSFVRWSIEHESAATLADLVERRLMLLYDQRITKACLRGLAELLVDRRLLPDSQIDHAVSIEIERLDKRFAAHVV